MRGKTEGADRGDESRAGGVEAAKSGGQTPVPGPGGEEAAEEIEEGKKEYVKGITDKGTITWYPCRWHFII